MSSDKYGDKNTLLSALNFKLNLFDIVPTERLLIFDELGNAKRVKARLTRFLENEPVSDSEKSNIRTTLGITSQGGLGDLLAANNLDDVASKDTSKLNLEIPDIGLQANQVPLSGMLNSGAWLDFDAFYETGTWTPTVSFGGGSTGITYSLQEGYYTRIGDTVYINCVIVLTSKGTDTGAFRAVGLPFAARNTSAGQQGMLVPYAANLAGLSYTPTAFIQTNLSEIFVYDWSATGASLVTDINFTNTSQIRFSGTYQIA